MRAGGAGKLGVPGQQGRLAFSNVVGSVLSDSVASQSNSSLPTISGFTTAVASVGTVRSG